MHDTASSLVILRKAGLFMDRRPVDPVWPDRCCGWFYCKTFSYDHLGKVLDPIADKLTQGAMLFCLVTRFPFMMAPLVLLILKEIFAGITGFLVIRNTGQVFGANWHGKAATILLYAMMILHVIWNDIPRILSDILIAICIVMMLVSLVLYGIRNVLALKNTNTTLPGKEKNHAK